MFLLHVEPWEGKHSSNRARQLDRVHEHLCRYAHISSTWMQSVNSNSYLLPQFLPCQLPPVHHLCSSSAYPVRQVIPKVESFQVQQIMPFRWSYHIPFQHFEQSPRSLFHRRRTEVLHGGCDICLDFLAFRSLSLRVLYWSWICWMTKSFLLPLIPSPSPLGRRQVPLWHLR